jgi:hypothetical protein
MRDRRQKVLDSPIAFLYLRLQVTELSLTFRELCAQLRDVRGLGCCSV